MDWQRDLLGLLAGFVLATVTTPVGVSGAVFLLPFQLSVLHAANPRITPTNLLFNVISGPGGLVRATRPARHRLPDDGACRGWRTALPAAQDLKAGGDRHAGATGLVRGVARPPRSDARVQRPQALVADLLFLITSSGGGHRLRYPPADDMSGRRERRYDGRHGGQDLELWGGPCLAIGRN